MAFDEEFKEALVQLSGKEKDKLILRLLKLDLAFAERLRFELLEKDSLEIRREKIEEDIKTLVHLATKNYYSPGYLLMDIRLISGRINEHVYVTKDKMGEISLNCLMISLLLELNHEKLIKELTSKCYTLYIYIIARVYKILIMVSKIHQDYRLEFKEELLKIGTFLEKNPSLLKMSKNAELDVQWLKDCEIPKDIAKIHTEVRKKGLLK